MASSTIKGSDIKVEHKSETVASVSANSYTDVTIARPSGTFLGATVRLGQTSNGIPFINNITATSIVVRIRNVSANAITNLPLDVWILVRA